MAPRRCRFVLFFFTFQKEKKTTYGIHQFSERQRSHKLVRNINSIACSCFFFFPKRDRQCRKQEIKLYGALTHPARLPSSHFHPGAVPGLASCQPSREPNDSFDPIRILAKSTLCSLRAHTCQLTTRPPSAPTLCASQRRPRRASLTCHRRANAGIPALSQC